MLLEGDKIGELGGNRFQAQWAPFSSNTKQVLRLRNAIEWYTRKNR